MTKALILAETADAQRTLCAGARTLADEVALVVVKGAPVTGVADKAYDIQLPEGEVAENAFETVKGVFEQVAPDMVLIEPTARGKILGGLLAASAGASVIAEISALDGGVAENMYFGGIAAKKQTAKTGCAFYSTTGAFFGDVAASGTDDVEAVAYVAPAKALKLRSTKEVPVEGADLTKSEIIVGVGRGFAEPEQLQVANELAAKIGADVGCSRPIAENVGWMPRNLYIGVSGVQAQPKAYIACGISGQMQHMVGVKNAGTIIAINKDGNAPIFKQTDLGIVGDVMKVLPAMTAKL